MLDQNSDTSDATGRLLINILGGIGQFETEISAERQKDGITRAKDRGVHFGKRPAFAANQVTELCQKRKQRVLIRDLMADCNLSNATIYRYLADKNS